MAAMIAKLKEAKEEAKAEQVEAAGDSKETAEVK